MGQPGAEHRLVVVALAVWTISSRIGFSASSSPSPRCFNTMKSMASIRKKGFPALSARRIASSARATISPRRWIEAERPMSSGPPLPARDLQAARPIDHTVEICHGPIEAAQGDIDHSAFMQDGRFPLPPILVRQLRHAAEGVAEMPLRLGVGVDGRGIVARPDEVFDRTYEVPPPLEVDGELRGDPGA